MTGLWTCSWCGSLNLPANDCLWCYGLRKQGEAACYFLARAMAQANYYESLGFDYPSGLMARVRGAGQ